MNAVLKGVAQLSTSSDYPVMLNSFNRNDIAILATFVSADNDVKLIVNSASAIAIAPIDSQSLIGTAVD